MKAFFSFLFFFFSSSASASVENLPKQVDNKTSSRFVQSVQLQEKICLLEKLITLDNIRLRFDVLFEGVEKEARKVIFFEMDGERISLLMVRGEDWKLRLYLSICLDRFNPNESIVMIDEGGDGTLDAMWFPGKENGTEEGWQEQYEKYISTIFNFLAKKAESWPEFG